MTVQTFSAFDSKNVDPSDNGFEPADRVGIFNATTLSALAVFSITLLHLARNISTAYYFVWLSAVAAFIIFWVRSGKLEAKRNLFFLVIIGLFLYSCILSYYWSNSFGDPTIGILRLGFIIPAVLCISYTQTNRAFDAFCLLWLGFVILAALSLPLQFVVGPISWFSESFERVGVERFGSLAGSLTTFGNIVGTAAFIAAMRVRKIHHLIFIISLLMLAAVLSLQKAAVASLGIAFLSILVARRFKFLHSIMFITSITFIVLLAFYVSDYQTRGTILLLFGNFSGSVDVSQASDVSIIQGASDRIFELPEVAFLFYGSDAVFAGIGVFGGSGSLGYPSLPHTHNLVGELILLFGLVPGALVVIFVLVNIVRSLFIILNLRKKYDVRSVIAAGILINITIPTIFSGALLYHPVGGTIFWVAIFQLYYYQNRRFRGSSS